MHDISTIRKINVQGKDRYQVDDLATSLSSALISIDRCLKNASTQGDKAQLKAIRNSLCVLVTKLEKVA